MEQIAASNAIQFYDYHPPAADFLSEVIAGLSQQHKTIAPKFFYDAEGSRLFDAICDTPEYYPTRTELAILKQNAEEISRLVGQRCVIIEPGSGNSQKIRVLLNALEPLAYIPMDISRDHLIDSAQSLADDYPWLSVHAACTDFTTPLTLPEQLDDSRFIAFFPGSSIGNFEPREAVRFLDHLGGIVGAGGGVLIGVDLKKDPDRLNAAYNDRGGLTARFNLNLLARINRELGANFDEASFSHKAFYNAARGRVEMHLVSERSQHVELAEYFFTFSPGETIHTENSYKYTIEEFQQLARRAGLHPARVWTDRENLFSVHFLEIP